MPFLEAIGSLDAQRPAPLYQQLQQAVRQAIERRTLKPDDALPPERDLANELSVSRITMLVTTGSACAPMAAMVDTSPARPPAPLGSLALKLITQAGAGCSCSVSPPAASGERSGLMAAG